MDIKITKRQLLKEVNNDMVHAFYYLVYGRIYNSSKTRYKKFKFVVHFEAWEIQEYFEQDGYTEESKREFIEEMIFCYIGAIKSYDDMKDFYELCNDTINRYNKVA